MLCFLCITYHNDISLSDGAGGSQTITFPPSESGQRQCVRFDILDDNIALEGDEQFNVDFTAPPGIPAGMFPDAWVTILDDDGVYDVMLRS